MISVESLRRRGAVQVGATNGRSYNGALMNF